MTSTDARWKVLGEQLLAQDWDGVEASANMFRKLHMSEVAETLDWISRRQLQIETVPASNGKVYKWYVVTEHTGQISSHQLSGLINVLWTIRNEALRFWE